MKILIVGYGSIGKRHYQILISFKNIQQIDIITKQNIKEIRTFKQLTDVTYISDYDYFVIASETLLHYEQLSYICSKVSNKKILVEKPLYSKKNKVIKTNNKIFTAYNLRFHPILEKLKNLLENEEVYYANILCGQYLPFWRPNQDYKKSYSADIRRGGGVLRDLSHELDYIIWLFGDISKIQYINTRISDLEIKADDIFTAIATTKKNIIINLSIDYISKIAIRNILIHTKKYTIQADVINSTIQTIDKNGNINDIKVKICERNYTYTKMHKAIISGDLKTICSFIEGENVVKLIDDVVYI